MQAPLLVDFDFRYETDIEDRQHSEDNITDMIQLYFEELRELINISPNTRIPVLYF